MPLTVHDLAVEKKSGKKAITRSTILVLLCPTKVTLIARERTAISEVKGIS